MINGGVVTDYLTSSMATRQAHTNRSPLALFADFSYEPDKLGSCGAVSHLPLSPAIGYDNPFVVTVHNPSVVTVHIPSISPGWIGSAIAKLKKLSELSENWDSYGGKTIEKNAVLMALNLIQAIYNPHVPEPAIVPVASGGIQFEWHTLQKDLEISLFPNDQASVYFEETGKPAVSSEGNFSYLLGQMKSLARSLG